MKKLIQGIVDFRKSMTPETRSLFAALALGQKPDSLFIACSDSRVVPNLFASTNPGDLFVVRNVGNLVPAALVAARDASVPAAIEFAVLSLNVADIIVCGHSECGAMKALLEDSAFPSLHAWLEHGKPALDRLHQGFQIDPALSLVNQLSQINVLQQIEHIASYSFVQERMKKKRLRIHGWWFDIAQADVYCYEDSIKQFVMIDENEAKLILSRLA